MNAYLDQANKGRNKWWHFVLALVMILFLWQGIGALPILLLFVWVMMDGNPDTSILSTGVIKGVEPSLSFTLTMLASVLFMIGIVLAIRFVHNRSFRSLITPFRSIAWRRIFQSFGIWFLISGLISLTEAWIFPGRYILTMDPLRFFPFLFLALILIPIQTSAEELLFRGYLLQGFGLRLRNIWILSSISGLFFMVPHLLNPEAAENYLLMGFYYFFIGAVMAYVTLRDGGLELALGLHAANNLFSALFANYSVTVLPTPSIFTINVLDAGFSVPAASIGLLFFVLVLRRSFGARKGTEIPVEE
jgi:uncharacterized protein